MQIIAKYKEEIMPEKVLLAGEIPVSEGAVREWVTRLADAEINFNAADEKSRKRAGEQIAYVRSCINSVLKAFT